MLGETIAGFSVKVKDDTAKLFEFCLFIRVARYYCEVVIESEGFR